MIDFSTHKEVEVDAGSGRAKVQPGATWADVDRATQAFGLVVPGGIVSATGVAGFTLGGGFGWVTRR
jgi:FAD/FMN-containing dehydrogenase